MPERVPTDSLRPIDREAFGYEQARHLLWRAGLGGPPEQVRALADWGPELAVERLVRVDEIDGYRRPGPQEFEAELMREPTEAERQAYRRALQSRDEDEVARFRAERQRRQRADRRQVRAMQRWWLERMIETPRPLEEKMTLFWHGLLPTSYRTIENSYHLYMQNHLYREHAVGNYGKLLFQLIRDPAMIRYLNNDQNRRRAPNENLARELMELFSLGEGHYSERDIREGARALTGYTFRGNEFWFNDGDHDTGVKQILGARGAMDGDDFVRAILERRACSEYICTRLYEFFVGAIPAPGDPARRPVERVVTQLAGTFRQNRYEIAPVLERLFKSAHFYDRVNQTSKIKSPVELVVGAVRSMRTPVRDLGILSDALGLMGQSLFFPPNVAGWEGGRAWINTSTLFVRQNILTFLLTGKTPTGYDPLASIDRYRPTKLLEDLAATDPGGERESEKVSRYLTRFALGAASSENHVDTLEGFFQTHGGRVNDQTVTGALALIAAMPEYQLC